MNLIKKAEGYENVLLISKYKDKGQEKHIYFFEFNNFVDRYRSKGQELIDMAVRVIEVKG